MDGSKAAAANGLLVSASIAARRASASRFFVTVQSQPAVSTLCKTRLQLRVALSLRRCLSTLSQSSLITRRV